MSYYSSNPDAAALGCGGSCGCNRCRSRAERRVTVCRPDCGCLRCRTLAVRLGESYEEDSPEPPPPPPKSGKRPNPTKAGAAAEASSGGMEGWYGESPGGGVSLQPPTFLPPGGLRQPAYRSPTTPFPVPALRMPPYATIDGFGPNQSALIGPQMQAVQGLARMIDASWRTTMPVASLRFAGFMSMDETPQLDSVRARVVREALVGALLALNPGLVGRIRWEPDESRGATNLGPRVEIYAWMGPTPPPATRPPPRIPPASEFRPPGFPAVPLPPYAPETPDERIRQILRTLPPPLPPRRSFNQMFWNQVDERLDSVMRRTNIPPNLRGFVRDGARAAIERGAEAIFDRVLDAARITGEPREAVKGTVGALLHMPIR